MLTYPSNTALASDHEGAACPPVHVSMRSLSSVSENWMPYPLRPKPEQIYLAGIPNPKKYSIDFQANMQQQKESNHDWTPKHSH